MKLSWLGLALAACSLQAHGLGNLAAVEIMNRDSGETLPVYRSRGEYWVAGMPGARYAVVIHNNRGERVLAVTSVDGINVISGEAAAYGQTGYVFRGGERYAINGWRKSNQEVADFNFTAMANSYAARTGRPANVGVIGVALFLERPAPVVQAPSAMFGQDLDKKAEAQASAGARDSASELNEVVAGAARAAKPLSAPASPKLGTGHGEREYSYVMNTAFERMSNSPNEIIRIRYDSFENLVAMGVVRPPASPVPRPNAFPDSPVSSYVPDPPGI
jgi:hypothetical protein